MAKRDTKTNKPRMVRVTVDMAEDDHIALKVHAAQSQRPLRAIILDALCDAGLIPKTATTFGHTRRHLHDPWPRKRRDTLEESQPLLDAEEALTT